MTREDAVSFGVCHGRALDTLLANPVGGADHLVQLARALDMRSEGPHDRCVIFEVSFDRVAHLIRVPVTLCGDRYRFLVDTGIGVTVVSSAVATRPDVHPIGETFAAQRMSGQVIEAPLVQLPSLELGGYQVAGHIAVVADLGEVDGEHGFAGILGPGFFEHHVVTTAPQAMTLTVQQSATFGEDGFQIPLEIRRHGPSLDPFAALILPSGREILVEVDTGSDSLILDTRFMADCGVQADSAAVTTKTGEDETGYQWTRHWATADGEVYLAAAPRTAQAQPRVMFQDIVHDGLVGADYLERYRMSFDVSGCRMILSPQPSPLR